MLDPDKKNVDQSGDSIDRIGPFTFTKESAATRSFASMLYERFLANKDNLGLEEPTTQVKIEEVTREEATALIGLLSESISPTHGAKFGVIVHGVFTTSQFDELPDLSQTKDLVLHGTDASRGTKVLVGGFKVPQQHAETKTDGLNPMYGVGICTSPLNPEKQAAGKAMAYTNENGYSTSTVGEGPVFVLRPNRGKTYQAKRALWGNMIPDGPNGASVDWRDSYDSIEALPRGAGGDSNAANFPELTLKSADQAHPVAVMWVERVPVTDPRYHELGMDKHRVINQIPTTEKTLVEEPTQPIDKTDSPLARLIKGFLNGPKDQSIDDAAVDTEEDIVTETSSIKGQEQIASIEEKLGVRVLEVFDAQNVNAAKTSVRFDTHNPEGFEVGPDEGILVNLPSLDGSPIRTIRTAIIQHRLDPKRWYPGQRSPRRYQRIRPGEIKQSDGKTQVLRRGNPPSWFTLDPQVSYLVDKGGYFNERATNPPKTETYVHDTQNNKWISLGVKIAEPRPTSEPEEERIYDVMIPAGNFDRLLLVGRGTGDAAQAISTLHRAELVFYPESNVGSATYQEHVFTRGVVFKDLGNPASMERYKPTSANGGTSYGYPNAVEIGGHKDQPRPTYPEELLTEPGSELSRIEDGLGVALRPGKTVSLVEVACGDTVFGSGPGQNKSGWAELKATIIDGAGAQKAIIIDGEAVPPYGILSGAADSPYIIQPGDKLVVSSAAHPAWIMGLRIQYL